MNRIALVIGNASYQFARPLRNTKADAGAIAAKLASLGFLPHEPAGGTELKPYIDQSLADMNRLLANFNRAARDAEMAIIYFSGHGIEIDNHNYLIPVEAELTDVIDVDYRTVALSRAIESVSKASRLRLILLDACRDNPFAYAMKGLDQGKSLSAGLAAPTQTRGAMVFYAAEEGQKAREGVDGALSPFAKALVSGLSQPNTSVIDMLGAVTGEVRRTTKDGQRPRIYGELLEERVVLNETQRPEPPQDIESPPKVALLGAGTDLPANPDVARKDVGSDADQNGGTKDSQGKLSQKTGDAEAGHGRGRQIALAALIVSVAVSVVAYHFNDPKPTTVTVPTASVSPQWADYSIYIHSDRLTPDIDRLKQELTTAGFKVLGIDKNADQPAGLPPQTAIDYATSTDAVGNSVAADKVASVVLETLGIDAPPRRQSTMQDRRLGVWLPADLPSAARWISAEQWANGPPDQGFCFQRKDSPATPGKYLMRCFQTNDLCLRQRNVDSGTLTACAWSTKLKQTSIWKDSGPGGILNSWFKYANAPFPSPPFPDFK